MEGICVVVVVASVVKGKVVASVVVGRILV